MTITIECKVCGRSSFEFEVNRLCDECRWPIRPLPLSGPVFGFDVAIKVHASAGSTKIVEKHFQTSNEKTARRRAKGTPAFIDQGYQAPTKKDYLMQTDIEEKRDATESKPPVGGGFGAPPCSTLLDVIRDVENSHFRTVHDTGANPAAMLIWNIVRDYAGLPWLRKSDLPAWDGEKYAMPADSRLLSNEVAAVRPLTEQQWIAGYGDPRLKYPCS